jgi:tripartite-type tricarboxylate transporter receptor subunit TctC
MRMWLTRSASCAAALVAMSSAAFAQQYPAKPIRLLVGFAAGGPSDVASRTVGQKLTQKWGQQIIVDIRPGAGGTIASDAVAKAPPDGYTLLLPAFSHAVNPSLISKLPYDTLRDFTPIVLFASTANMLVTHPSIPAKTVRELIAFAKARPNQLTYGSAGNGTASHLAGELLNTMGGVSITHVPYKGIAPAHTDTMGGQISMMFDSLVTGIPAVKAGRLRAFGVTTLKRWPGAPDVPTMSEAGLTGYEVNSWYGLMGPAGLSREIVQRLNAEVIRSMAEPDARERLYSIGAEPMSNTPEEFAAYIRSEMAKWDKVVKAAGIRAE